MRELSFNWCPMGCSCQASLYFLFRTSNCNYIIFTLRNSVLPSPIPEISPLLSIITLYGKYNCLQTPKLMFQFLLLTCQYPSKQSKVQQIDILQYIYIHIHIYYMYYTYSIYTVWAWNRLGQAKQMKKSWGQQVLILVWAIYVGNCSNDLESIPKVKAAVLCHILLARRLVSKYV